MPDDRAAAAREQWREIRRARREAVATAHRDALADPAYCSQSALVQYDALSRALGFKFGLSTFYHIRKIGQ